jgi:3-oxoacyl-[acyl-carrier-protein] synthase II
VRRVLITGIGLITPLGVGAAATWKALLEGRSAIGPVRGFDASSLRTRLAAEIDGLPVGDLVPTPRMRRTMTRADVLALGAATLALRDAGIELTEEEAERAALFVGGNKEISDPSDLLEATLAARDGDGRVDMRRFGATASSRVHPLFFIQGLQAASLFYISQTHGLKGANTYFAGGAESGAFAIARGYRAVRRGEADVALAGGFDDAVSWWNMSKLDGLGMMSASNDRGPEACRPYDRERDGTVLGEGAAFLVLEDAERARRRGARVFGELAGCGTGFDGRQLVTPDPEGAAISRAIDSALAEAGVPAEQIGYVAAHGSGTRLGDASEARALARAFDGRRPRASSVKPATGHLVAAAGALNVAVAALAVAESAVPPLLHLADMDPACQGADWVTAAEEVPVGSALALARGVEGQCVALEVDSA